MEPPPPPVIFNPIDREKYRNPPTPIGYVKSNPPDIVRRRDPDEFDIDFDEWIALGIFDEPDVSIYERFVLNTDSEDDDIVEVPVEPVIKNVESICLSDDDDEIIPIPLENIKKEKEEITIDDESNDVDNQITTEQRTEEIPSTPKQRTEEIPSTPIDVEVKSKECTEQRIKEINKDEIKQTEQRIDSSKVKYTKERTDKKLQDKDDEAIFEKRTDKHKEKTSAKTDKRREKKIKRDDEGNRHKKMKLKMETFDSDKSSRRKGKLSARDSDSDSEIEEERHRRKVKKHRPPSPSEDYKPGCKAEYGNLKKEYEDDYTHPATSIKQEYPSLHGSFHCEICNLTLNSYTTYQSHVSGKRHKKNQDAKNVAQTAAKSFIPIKLPSKCPNPPSGFMRMELNSHAMIQKVIDDNDKSNIPSLGLHKVIEIQSVSETSYYCSLCDAPCSVNSILPHLSGFKHQLNCLKHYDFTLYEEIKNKQKYQIESIVYQRLRELEKKYGRSRLKVEKDVPDDGLHDYRASIPSTSFIQDQVFKKPSIPSRSTPISRDHPSTSKQADFSEIYQSCSVPDPSKSGFYCRICDSHSNSKAMWDAHIGGKRHIANVKKAPGTAPSKSRNVPAPPGTIARLYSQLEDVYDEPIVGLDQIREIQRLDIDSVSYTCFLCGGISVCEGEIMDHILLMKHRMKYLEKIKYPSLETLRSCQMSEMSLSALIAEMCENVEHEQGRGEPEVYYAKNSLMKM